jgi:hypothetical protein
MTRSSPARRRSTRTPKTTLNARAVILAGLGAVSLGRKQAIESIDGLADGAQSLRSRADAAARDAGKRVAQLRKQAQSRLVPLKKQAVAFAKQAQASVEIRLSPVLVTLGVKPAKAKRPARATQRAARPAVKRTRARA